MVVAIDDVVLKPGAAVAFADRDSLLETLDRLDQRIPARNAGRTRDHREHYCMVRYLRFLAGDDLLPLPATLHKPKDDPPDFILAWDGGQQESFELTDGSTSARQEALAQAKQEGKQAGLPLDVNDDTINPATPTAADLWAAILFDAFEAKATMLIRGRFTIDHLLIYDLTGLGLLVPLEDGAPLLRRKIKEWYEVKKPAHRFGRISILRDQALLLDVLLLDEKGSPRVLRATSPYFQVPVLRARDEEDLKARQRSLDTFCRANSIRHLKVFGSVLGDHIEAATEAIEKGESAEAHLFGDDSDLDVLVEFEGDARVTLLDMARMERELSELIGFPVDLRTAEDLSQYFRQNVLSQAVGL
jgi:hypothetical protein